MNVASRKSIAWDSIGEDGRFCPVATAAQPADHTAWRPAVIGWICTCLIHRYRRGALVGITLGLLTLPPLLALPTRCNAEETDAAPQQTLGPAEASAEFDRLATICEQLGLQPEANFTRGWVVPERPEQRLFYLPSDWPANDWPAGDASASDSPNAAKSLPAGTMPQRSEDESPELVRNHKFWRQSFQSARDKLANGLFEKAHELAIAGDEAAAFRRLWQVLRESPEHSEAGRLLGRLASAAKRRPQLRTAGDAQPQLGWAPRSYSRILTPHFELLSRADRRDSVQLAEQLERYYAVWCQFFYPLWSPPGFLIEQFNSDGKPANWPEPKRMTVVLLKDRQEYLTALGAAESQIAVSVGYYAPDAKLSFFYPDKSLQATLVHELTHQLLAEATHWDVRNSVGAGGGVWLIEGIAMYMESLENHGHYWTLGGVEAPRLQTARYRAVRDGYWPDWSQFSSANLEAWKQSPELARFYTHAVGLVHCLLDELDSNRDGTSAVFRALGEVYQATGSATVQFDELLMPLGENEAAAKEAYQRHLIVSDEDLQRLLRCKHQPSELVLCGSNLDSPTWQGLSNLRALRWLDVSFSNVQADDLQWLSTVETLERLSVEGTAVDASLLKTVANLPNLQELDLSLCKINSEDLAAIAGMPTLQTLWLTGTSVDASVLATLDSLPSLTQCDVRDTQIPTAVWREFVARHPRLQ